MGETAKASSSAAKAEQKKPTGSKTKEESPEYLEKDIISVNPDLKIAQTRFLASRETLPAGERKEKWNQLMEHIKTGEMGPFYELVCQEMNMPIDATLLADLKAKNAEKLATIEAEIKDATENLGESEVRQAWLRKSEYLCQIGAKDDAVSAFRQTYEKTVGIGYRIDLVFNVIRLGLFFMDHQIITTNLAKAQDLMELGGDWERKNRLRSYEGLYKMSVRDFKAASALFLEAVPTFGSYELMSYEDLVFYTVVTGMLALERPDLREKVVKCSEVQEQLVGGGTDGRLVVLREYLESFYECHYDRFFVSLASLESERLQLDRYLEPHYGYYSRCMRLKAYDQFLTPYKTVRLDLMAADFGVTKEFLDKELHGFIASGELHCRIDGVQGVIDINHPDSKNDLYKSLIKDGDILLNRIQKLSRVIYQ